MHPTLGSPKKIVYATFCILLIFVVLYSPPTNLSPLKPPATSSEDAVLVFKYPPGVLPRPLTPAVDNCSNRSEIGHFEMAQQISDAEFDQRNYMEMRRVRLLDCKAIIEGDSQEIQIAEAIGGERQLQWRAKSDKELILMASNCDWFTETFGYNFLKNIPLSSVEIENPIAYSIVFHKDVFQVERLLSNIYRRHNWYCLHVDKKSSDEALEAAQSLARCLPNVFLSSGRESVIYAAYSRLQADLNCMQDLLLTRRDWTYLINLTGQMFPLKTNREIATILRTLQGTNDIEVVPRFNSVSLKERYEKVYHVVGGRLVNSGRAKEPLGDNITLLKGSVFGLFSRPFVQYVLSDPKVKRLLEFLKDVYSPDELIWATLNSNFVNPMFHAPGGYEYAPERRPWLSTYASWEGVGKCAGQWQRSVCVFGVGDLNRLVWRRQLFANKFLADLQPAALDCLEEWLANRTVANPPFDAQYYRDIRYYLNRKG